MKKRSLRISAATIDLKQSTEPLRDLIGRHTERGMEQELLGFPLWLRINHCINLFCIFVLMRSGVQILADHPKLYWNDDTTPGSEWIKFGKKVMPRDRLCCRTQNYVEEVGTMKAKKPSVRLGVRLLIEVLQSHQSKRHVQLGSERPIISSRLRKNAFVHRVKPVESTSFLLGRRNVFVRTDHLSWSK